MNAGRLLALLLVALALPACAGAAVRYTVTYLGTLGTGVSCAQAINDRGQVVGSVDTGMNSARGFLWDGTMHDIGSLGGSYTVAYGINEAGQVVGTSTTGPGDPLLHAFVHDGAMHDIGTPGGDGTVAYGINASGVAVVSSFGSHAFLYDGTMHDLGTYGRAVAINDWGQVVGDDGLFYDGSWHYLGDLNGWFTRPTAINDRGMVAGYAADPDYVGGIGGDFAPDRAFLYDGAMHDLGIMPDGVNSRPTAINDAGLVVGWGITYRVNYGDSLGSHAFLYDGSAMYDLNDLIDPASGWMLSGAYDINNRGQIVGGGYNSLLHQGGAVLVTPVPEPSSLTCVASALPALWGVVRMRKRRAVLPTASTAVLLLATLVAATAEVITTPPEGFTYLPTFPRFFWSSGCLPTSGAMILGYYSNSGFPRMCKQKVDDDYVDYICPTGSYPNDNGMFLKQNEAADMYPSRCPIGATEKGVFGRGEDDYGHIDDYYGAVGGLTDLFLTYNPGANPKYSWNYPWTERGLHGDDCVADFMGASIYWSRFQPNGSANIELGYIHGGAQCHGAPYTWVPASCTPTQDKLYPYPNVPPQTGNTAPSSRKIDAIYGLARYVVDFAKYHSKEVEPPGSTGPYYDVWRYACQYVNGTQMPEWWTDPLGGTGLSYIGYTEGATEATVMDEIDAGRPVIAIVVDVNNNRTRHAFPIWGYRKEDGQPLQMLVYDTWNEDCLIDPQTQEPYESTSYRIVDFPNPYYARQNISGFTRASWLPNLPATAGIYWRVYGVCCLQINDNPRCPDALQSTEYPSNTEQNPYTEPLDVAFNLTTFGENSVNRRVHFTLDGKDPNPNSPCFAINGSTGVLHVGSNCDLKLRTYADGDELEHPGDGYLAGRVIERTYWISATKTNAREYADGDGIMTAPMIVTRGTSASDHYCYVENQDRTSGTRVQVGDTDTVTEGDLVSVVGRFATNGAGERFIDQAVVTVVGTPADPILPLCMPNRSLGGGDWNYDSESGAGQKGVTGGTGLNNIGLLVRTTGCVSTSGSSDFYITDGSGADVRVVVPSGVSRPAAETYVGVTGVCSCELQGQDIVPVLLARNADDIVGYGDCESSGIQAQAPAQSGPTEPAVQATDTVAWALSQIDGTSVTVNACSVLESSADGLVVSDGWSGMAPAIVVPGDWAVARWSTVDVTGTLTTLAGGVRAINATQVLVYTDSRGRPFASPMPWRSSSGQLLEDWPYKQAANRRSQ